MASPKYGCLDPKARSKVYPVEASQYFYHNGVNAVILSADGLIQLAITADQKLFGFAVVPGGMGAGTNPLYWLSSATAGKDKIPVILAVDKYSFLLPADDTVTASMKGNACDMIAVNDGTATTVDVGTGSQDVFTIQDLGVNVCGWASATDVVVKINLNEIQILQST